MSWRIGRSASMTAAWRGCGPLAIEPQRTSQRGLAYLARAHERNGRQIEFMCEVTAGRVSFGPDDAEPILGVTALQSVGITIDPTARSPNACRPCPSGSAPGRGYFATRSFA
jgi:hypothetical protein